MLRAGKSQIKIALKILRIATGAVWAQTLQVFATVCGYLIEKLQGIVGETASR